MKISKEARAGLKKPLGKVYTTLEAVKTLSKRHRVISVGDICTLALLCIGIRPHLAVFDLRYMRKALPQEMALILKREFGNTKTIKNRHGTVSGKLLKNANEIMKKGGAIKIDGEEDLTALAFIKNADAHSIIVYGQPNEGMVIVKPDKKTKEIVNRILMARG